MIDFGQLDNPIWHALNTVHAPMARVHGLAIRYPSSVSPLSALREVTRRAFDDMRALVEPGSAIAFFTTKPIEVPGDWQVVRSRDINQMACSKVLRPCLLPLLGMTEVDVPEMLALTALTEPGPFLSETIRMGNYYGIRAEDGGLAAMAGQRLQTHLFTEVSAVCTDPAHRGRGYAAAIVAYVAQQAIDGGKTAFLNVFDENGAKALYEKVGFSLRRVMHLTVVTPI